MEFELDRKKPECPVVDIDGVIAKGKQFDLDITLPDDNRDVIYGVVKNCFKEPVVDAVVKLVEVEIKYGKKELKPVSHTFTDKEGEFVFGPLCPGKEYAIQIWVDDVKHVKVCAKCHHEGKCLKGVNLECKPDYDKECCKEKYREQYKKEYKENYKDEYEKEYKEDYKDEYKKDDKEDHKDECKKECKENHKDECKKDDKEDHKDECKKNDTEEHKCECKKEYNKYFKY